ncbi:hypothetical protein EWI07_02900 [Sporolactobacillus sp. THM7-4]|nr:hypothetical protein EWI07_02900 [Sporolactobacillus sp. THM7-4]
MLFVIGSVVLIGVVINQLREKPLTGKLYRQPLALLMFSGYALFRLPVVSAGDWSIIAMSLCLSFSLGLLKGRYTPLTNRDGAWYLSGSFMAVIIWFISIPMRYALKYVSIHFLSLTPFLEGSSSFIVYFISIAGFLLGIYTMLLMRYPQLIRDVGKNEEKLKRLRQVP